jgi:hypothetical protein
VVQTERRKKENSMEQIPPLYPENKSLAAVHRSWDFPTDDDLLLLLRQGVNGSALWPISGATVRFDGSTFDLDPNGVRALTFRCQDCGEVIDIAAWQPQTGELGSWRGVAFCLGDLDDIFNPATYFADSALPVHETPLQWLLAEREGIVILRPDLAPVYLANCQRLACSNKAHARQLERWLQPPKPTTEIFVTVEEGAAV